MAATSLVGDRTFDKRDLEYREPTPDLAGTLATVTAQGLIHEMLDFLAFLADFGHRINADLQMAVGPELRHLLV